MIQNVMIQNDMIQNIIISIIWYKMLGSKNLWFQLYDSSYEELFPKVSYMTEKYYNPMYYDTKKIMIEKLDVNPILYGQPEPTLCGILCIILQHITSWRSTNTKRKSKKKRRR